LHAKSGGTADGRCRGLFHRPRGLPTGGPTPRPEQDPRGADDHERGQRLAHRHAPEYRAGAERRILVPEAALVEIDGQATAFVVERDLVRAAAVTVSERKGGRAAIEGGLHAGQRIVADPPPSLRDGDRVRLAAN